MHELFEKGRTPIKEGELIEKEVCRDSRHTTQHGAIKGKTQTSKIKYYNSAFI